MKKSKKKLLEENHKLRILLADSVRQDTIVYTSAHEIAKKHKLSFAGLEVEEFRVMLLDTAHKEIQTVTVSKGTLNKSLVHPRETFCAAVRSRAESIVLMHNHPSGDPTPGDADRAITKRLKEAGEILGIRVLDHLIFGGNRWFSFVDENML